MRLTKISRAGTFSELRKRDVADQEVADHCVDIGLLFERFQTSLVHWVGSTKNSVILKNEFLPLVRFAVSGVHGLDFIDVSVTHGDGEKPNSYLLNF